MHPYEDQYGFRLDDLSIIGCSLIRGDVQLSNGTFALPENGPECGRREQIWRDAMARHQPQVVLVLPGLWDAHNHRVNGELLEFGSLEAQPYWLAELRHVVDLLSQRGSRVVFLTAPLFPSDSYIDKDRIDELNRLVWRVASERPSQTAVIDLNHFLYPSGEFVSFVNGLNVRGDGFHFSLEGAVMVGRWIAPQLAQYAD
jgi:hypothetical protein